MKQQENSQGFSLQKLVSDIFPKVIGAGLTAFVLWSFVVAPYITTGEENAELSISHSNVSSSLSFSSSKPSSSSSSSSSRHNPGGMTHKTDFIPERTDIEWLLNKSASIDPLLNDTFSLGQRITDWDEQRRVWQEEHSIESSSKILLVSGQQPHPCQNTLGDYLMVKSLKNKVDYTRAHDMEIFYNMATFTTEMPSWWVKLPLLRSLMLSHPDVEWLWWVDSDAVFTDMSFVFPQERYRDHNFVIHGWDHLVYGERKWTGLNMGVFLVRNCQWTLDLFDTLAPMGLRGEVGDRIGKILTMSLSGRPDDFESDDQGAFIYLLNAEKDKWGSRVYLENSYYLNGYWKDIVDKFEELQATGPNEVPWPLMTHFTGCQICSGIINNVYTPDECRKQMERALVFADNQVLQNIGYAHASLSSRDIARIGS